MYIYNNYEEVKIPNYTEAENKCIVGVYGTLKRGYGNYNYFLKNQSYYMGKAIIRGLKLYTLGGFPGVRPGNRNDKVKIELFEIDISILKKIDRLEGIPFMYSRFKATHNKKNIQPIYFYMYNKNLPEDKRISEWK